MQVKTGSVVWSNGKKEGKVLKFGSVNGYKSLIALVCISMDDLEQSFYFDDASTVEEFSCKSNLDIPVKPKQKKKINTVKKLRKNHQVTFADLPAKLFKLYDRHAKAGTLMSWRDANAPAAKGKSTDLLVNSLTFVCFC